MDAEQIEYYLASTMAGAIVNMTVNLPPVNGVFEAGLAAGSEEGLLDIMKLPILEHGSRAQNRVYVPLIIYNELTAAGKQHLIPMMCSAALALIDIDLIRTEKIGTNTVPASDWRYATHAEIDAATALGAAGGPGIPVLQLSRDTIQKAITLMCGTKLNWYRDNHHTGSGAVSGYIKKVITSMAANDPSFNFMPSNDKERVDAVWRIGHWAPTRTILTEFGLPGCVKEDPFFVGDTVVRKLTPAADAKLRIDSLPNGTARCGIAYAGAKRLLASTMAVFCPDLANFEQIADAHANISADKAGHHTGAMYLTGKKRVAYDDNMFKSHLGRIGSFIHVTMKSSTLAKSPYIDGQSAPANATKAYQANDDFDPDFEAAMTAYMIQAATAATSVSIPHGVTGLLSAYQHAVTKLGVTPNSKVVAAYTP